MTSPRVGNRKHAKLPVWRSVTEAYRLTFANAAFLARVGWPFALAACAAVAARRGLHGLPDENGWNGIVEAIVSAAIGGLLIASIAVPWHRRVLAHDAGQGAGQLLVRTILVYAAVAVVLEYALDAPGSLFFSIENAIDPVMPVWFQLLGLLLLVVSGYLLSRFMLILPAIAINAPRTSLDLAWSMSRGNGWRLTFGNLLAFLPAAASWTLGRLLVRRLDVSADAAQTVFWVGTTASALYFVFATVALAYLSIAYRELAKDSVAT